MGTKSLFTTKVYRLNHFSSPKIGGAKRDRTADLNTASVALSQLSYGPSSRTRIVLNDYLSV